MNLQAKVLPFFEFSELNSINYFEKGTELNNPFCSKMLAKMYKNGLIIKKDSLKSLYYLRLTEKFYFESDIYKISNDFYDDLKSIYEDIFQENILNQKSFKDVEIQFEN